MAGTDTMIGGSGNDIFIVRQAADIVTEASGGGTDTVRAYYSHTLAANVENVVLIGTGASSLTGNALANSMTGNALANTIDCAGGADRMVGGLGNDTYFVNSTGDQVLESTVGGVDTVRAFTATRSRPMSRASC